MSATLSGYARCCTAEQDLMAQRRALLGLGVAEDRICLDVPLTGVNWAPAWPGAGPRGRAGRGHPRRAEAGPAALHAAGEHSVADLAELFSVSRPTVCRVLERVGGRPAAGGGAEGPQHRG